jgi:hypothetical protein
LTLLVVDNEAHITKHNLIAQFQIGSGFEVGEWQVTWSILLFLGLGTQAIAMPSNKRIPYSGHAIDLYLFNDLISYW